MPDDAHRLVTRRSSIPMNTEDTLIPLGSRSSRYERPTLVRFGSFRDLTRIGTGQPSDGVTISGVVSGCEVDGRRDSCPTAS